MNECKPGLTWVHADEKFGEFKPFRPPSAETPEGVYSVTRCAYKFDAWFLAHDGAMTFLGTSRTLLMAMKQCEHREARKHAQTRP